MSKPFRRIYPERGAVLFDGGKNSKFERSIIEDNESPDCANVIFDNGSVGTRPGYSKFNSTAVGSYVCDGLFTRRGNDNAETMIAAFGGNLYAQGASTFVTIPSAQSVFTAGTRFTSAMDENYLFVSNGGAKPYKWDGTYFTRHGVYPPTVANIGASAAFGAASAATGAAHASGSSFTYKTVFLNSALVESDVGPAKTFVVAANSMGNVALTSLPVAPQSFGVSTRRIYRTAAGGSTYKLVTTIADNTTTTYDDAIVDASLGATAPTDNGVPPLYNACIQHQGRIFMNDTANPSLVWWTEIGSPYTVAIASNFKRIGDNTSDLVKGFAVFDNSLIVFCEKSITICYMPDTDDSGWQWVTSRSSYGSKSPHALVTALDRILFPAVQGGKLVGFGAFNGDTVDPSATLLTVSTAGSEMQSDRIEPDVFDIQNAYMGNISSIVFKNKAYIAVTHGSGSTTNNRVYVLDFSASNMSKNQKSSWVPWTGIKAAQFTVYDGSLYFGSADAVGRVYKVETSVYSDDGAAIDSYFWTKEFSGYADEFNFHKDFRFLNMLVDNAGAYYMNLTYRVDSDSGSGDTEQINLDPGSSLWGTMIWGINTWGGGSTQAEKDIGLSPARGKRIQFKFSNQNTAGQRFKVHRASFSYNLKGFR